MIRYWDFEESERSNLSEDEVQSLLNVEMMEKGVRKPETPVLMDEEPPKLLTTTYFGVEYSGEYSSPEKLPLVFPTIESAKAFINLVPHIVRSDWRLGDQYPWARDASEEYAISQREISTEQTINDMRGHLQRVKANKEANTKARSDFNTACEEVTKVSNLVWEDWHDCRERKCKAQEVLDTFVKYTEMCDGSKETAGYFLLKIYDAGRIDKARTFHPEVPASEDCIEPALSAETPAVPGDPDAGKFSTGG